MSIKDTTNKTVDTWTTKADEIFTKYGLQRNYVNKTGACIMPAPMRKRSVNSQENTEGETKTDED